MVSRLYNVILGAIFQLFILNIIMNFFKQLKELDKYIEQNVFDNSRQYGLITDGVINPTKYNNSNIKILSILKEANDTEMN
jgi:hypothetical protein